jgi:hypothetical protein
MPLVSLGASPGSADLPFERSVVPVSHSNMLVSLSERLVTNWRNLIASNTTLFLILLSVNAWALPYAGVVQDSRLYGIQVINRIENGSFGDDLYLQFGSQDRYTYFSSVAVPLVRTLGLRPAFFLIYLVSIAVFLWGTQRVVLGLCENRLVASLALVFMATTPMTFAGMGTFFVNESFVTPRIAANGLILWALALSLEQKPWNALLLIVLALALHPLMACGGSVVYLAYFCAQKISKWHLIALGLVLLAGGTLIFSDPLAGRLLGRMDGDWRDAVRRANPYCFPSEWAVEDWMYIVGALTIALAACTGPLQSLPQRRMVACVAGIAVAGTIIHLAACQLFYALPIQGQGYRWLWLLQYLQIPCGLLLISSWWRQGTLAMRVAAVVLAAYLGGTVDRLEILVLLPSLAAFAFYLAAPPQTIRQRLGLISCFLGVGWLLFHEVRALHAYWLEVIPYIDFLEFMRTAPRALLRFARWSVAILGILGLAWFFTSRRAIGYALAAAAILLQVGYFAAAWAATMTNAPAGIPLVREYLKEHGNPQNPTIYWPGGWVDHLWFDLHANSYFEPVQIAGNVYSRETAMEGRRRIQLVKRFQMKRVREQIRLYSPRQLRQGEEQYQAKLSEPDPTWDDVKAVCNDPKVDYLLLKQDFAGHSVTTDGVWYLYDCQAIREARPLITDP